MNKIKYVLLSIILIIFIINIDIVIESCKYSSILFFNKIFVCIFPFIILCDILIYYDYHLFLKNIFGNLISKLFKINPNASIIFILSIFTGTPANSIYIKDMLDNKQIDINTAQRILAFTYFSSIPFVIGTIGISLYKSFKIGLILYVLMIVHNIIIGLFLRNDNYSYNPNSSKYKKEKNIFILLKKSIIKAIESSFIILGNLIIFSIISKLLFKYISFNNINTSIISGILEITNGIILTHELNINIVSKIFLTLFFLNFTSLSILFQSFSLLNEYSINIKRILLIKTIFSIPYLLFFILSLYFY